MWKPARVAAATLVLVFGTQAVADPLQRRKKKDEETTQTLAVLPDPPTALLADVSRLGFVSAPLSAKGLLSQQTRDGLKALIALARGAQFIQIRAFVAGTGDMRRIQSIVADEFSDRRLSLPVLTVLQVGALPMEGAQVQLEATLLERKPLNPAGIAFAVAEAETPAAALELLRARLISAGMEGDPMRLLCATTSMEGEREVKSAASHLFPRNNAVWHQAQRAALQAGASCSAAAKLASRAEVRYEDGAVAIPSGSLVFAGAQLAFRYQEADARLAFQRLEKTMQAASTSLKNAVLLNTYPLSPQMAELVRKVLPDFINPARHPAGALLPYEGLPALDAAFALEAVALAGPGGHSSVRNPK